MTVHLFGIRHHGPGCARSLLHAFETLQPDCILIEGPPDADALIAFAGLDAMQPPVALLVYMPAAPQRAVYYPFAEYSPEWQAMRFGQRHGIPTRFCDLPQSLRFERPEEDANEEASEPEREPEPEQELRGDPLHWLASAAGFSDTDTWWEHLVEQRGDSLELFAAIAEMMTVVRSEIAPAATGVEAQREAWMRNSIRQAQKQGYQRIAVVCGAFHVPALATLPSAKSDADLLKGLVKTKVAATWTPWSFGRLAYRSGYGAGVQAPGWYEHLWRRPEQASLYWLTDVATLLRSHDLDGSPAHIIEAARLADTLAALRERPRPGLSELQEAVQAVFCYDSDAPLKLIHDALLIKDRLGHVPEVVPMLPLPADVQAQQKRLRLPVRAEHTPLDLDLREPAHLEKSVLLHRLALLGIDWGRREQVRGKSGTFHELWRLRWQPEYSLNLIEANVWGATLESAATGCAMEQANKADTLPALTTLVEKVLLADLRAAIDAIMARIQEVSAHTPDLGFLLGALPPLANATRYGSVRDTDTAALAHVVDGLIVRACIAMPLGVTALADEAASTLLEHVIGADRAVRLLQVEAHSAAWFAALAQCATSDATHPLISGRCARILSEQNHWTREQVAQQLALHCSPAAGALACAHWLEGFLQGSGALLVHDDTLWGLIHAWLGALPAEAFVGVLPLLRRTFASFAGPERRQLGERALQGPDARKRIAPAAQAVDAARARRILPVLEAILGVNA